VMARGARAPSLDPAEGEAGGEAGDEVALRSLGLVIDLYLANALAPAVVLVLDRPNSRTMADALLDTLPRVLTAPITADVTSRDSCIDSKASDATATSHANVTGTSCMRIIRETDVLKVKMNRSLYDARGERSLRDEILDILATSPRVGVELLAPTVDAELHIREMVEDSPSTVAHSVHRRILHKQGVLFLVRLGATSVHKITPELLSRASLVL